MISFKSPKVHGREMFKYQKIIEYHAKEILKTMFAVASTIFTCLSFLLCVMSWDELIAFGFPDKLMTILLIILVSMIAAVLWVCVLRRNYVIYENGTSRVQICYGDVIRTGFSERKDEKKIVVIPVNNSFDTIVDKDIDKIEKPLVAETSIHGQWIQEMVRAGKSIIQIDEVIERGLRKETVVKCLKSCEKARGKLEHYAIGTIVPFAVGNTVFLLAAESEFDKNNNAESTEKDVVKCAVAVLNFWEQRGQGYDIYIPLMGTGMSKADLSHQDSLRILKSLCLLHGGQLRGELNIVIYTGDKDRASIFD